MLSRDVLYTELCTGHSERAGGRGLTVHATVRRRGEVVESELPSANGSLHVAAAAVTTRGLLASHLTAQTSVTSPQ